VFERGAQWTAHLRDSLPARLMAYDECSATDRYYMLATGFGARGERSGTPTMRTALALADVGLERLIPLAARLVRGIRRFAARLAARRGAAFTWFGQ
jgi:hypothetical protein